MDVENVVLLERELPSANVVLVRGERPVLIDSGYGSDAADLDARLHALGMRPESLDLVLNTHFHTDHAGGNHHLQSRYGVRVAAHRWEADLVNRRAPEACSAAWLDQPIEPYRVDVPLAGGEVVETGSARLEVLHTPGHTLGHLSFWDAASRTLVSGDTVHLRDVAWVNPFLEGAGAADRLAGSLERLASLGARVVLTGHGPPLTDPDVEFRSALARLTRWIAEPERLSWHGAKRILAYVLMLRGGLTREELEPYLLARPWVHDYARHAFRVTDAEFAGALVAEMLRSNAARWDGDVLRANLPHHVPDRAWLAAAPFPADWP
ncbi:MBL fold metallo-hydrolase [Deinococcus pimensis]|uniref:MBL fold metallo-hydrolase n=1 Tax=Deinococcus pimensis TaxID=309888 RepID=UPI0004860F0E|nr:MBL fold metallo-hydrolase [Deinococcus pimensis]